MTFQEYIDKILRPSTLTMINGGYFDRILVEDYDLWSVIYREDAELLKAIEDRIAVIEQQGGLKPTALEEFLTGDLKNVEVRVKLPDEEWRNFK